MTEQKLVYWAALFVAVIANVVANSALKVAVASVSANSDRGVLLQLLSQASLWVGLAFATVLLVSYMAALRGLPASTAYVVVSSLAVLGLLVVDNALYGIPLGGTKLLGTALAVGGVWLMTRAA
jgi:multidrug transporter EmrE-like cation transporter